MATIRPILTNFAMGELSPKLSGRSDLSLYTKGAKEMTNALPWTLGGAGKRGGLEYKLLIDSVGTGACRLIPWSISNDIDLMLVLYDRSIKILNVSGGMNPSFLQMYGADLLITNLDAGEGTAPPLFDSYASADIPAVRYAQSLTTIMLVHQKYPPFFIRSSYSYNTGTGAFDITLVYGSAAIIGNIAVTQFVSEVAVVYKEFSSKSIIDGLKAEVQKTAAATEAKTYLAAQGLVGTISVSGVSHAVTSVAITRDSTYESIIINGTARTAASSGTVGDSYSAMGHMYLGVSMASDIHWGSLGYRHKDQWLDGYMCEIPMASTWDEAIALVRQLLTPGRSYTVSSKNGERGQQAYTSYSCVLSSAHSKFSVVIMADGISNISFDSDQSAQTLMMGSISISSIPFVINGYAMAMVDMIDRLAPWMVEDKQYPCSAKYLINGNTPAYAQKRTVAGEPSVFITFTNGNTLVLSRSSDAKLTGQVGVILTPFGQPGEFPGVVAFHQGRLCLGGSVSEPNVLYMSKVNDSFNFAYFEEIEYIQTAMKPESEWTDPDVPEYETKTNTIQQTGSSSAICLVIATDENEAIQSLVAQDDLFIGTSTSEWIFPAGLTALNPRVSLVTRYGSANLQARFVRDSIMFVTTARTGIRAFGAPGADLLQYAEHMAKAKIVSFDFRQDPHSELYAVLEDGTCIVGRISDEGVAWYRIQTYGGNKIESVACIRASDEDAVYFVVQRVISGSTFRSVERLKTTDDSVFTGRCYLDNYTVIGAGFSVTAARFSGQAVSIRFIRTSDGSEHAGTITATGGAVTTYIDDLAIDRVTPTTIGAFTSLIYGIPYNTTLETLRIDTPGTEGIPKKADAIFFRCYQTGPFDLVMKHPAPAGDPSDTEDRFPITAPTYDGVVQYPYTGTIRYENMDPWGPDQSIRIESNSSAPLGIQLILPQYQVGDSL